MARKSTTQKSRGYKASVRWLTKDMFFLGGRPDNLSVAILMYVQPVKLLAFMFDKKEIDVASDVKREAIKEFNEQERIAGFEN